jgi:multiple sugar transport system substrate-binding protein
MSALAGVSVAGSGALLAACGGGNEPAGPGGGGGGGGGELTWANWANPGEAERFKQFSADYQKKTGTKINYQQVTGDYPSKLLTQLSSGSAPDVFYVGDTLIGKAIESKTLEELSGNPQAKALYDATYKGLRDWHTSADGGIYGIEVDCNPETFWFNKKLLAAAGISQDPAAAFEAGTWNQNTLTDMLTKVKDSGKKAAMLEASWGNLFSWITTFGGTIWDGGKAVFDTDPKAQAAIGWLFEQLNNGNMTYAGSLPKGQGVDALFFAGQVAFVDFGRWILPNVKKLKSTIEYDIAPFPSEDGKTVMPVAVYTACMSINAATKNKEAAYAFLESYCNKEGMQFRLSGGGNAVPSQAGLEGIVTENNDPPHGKFFNDIAAAGYAVDRAFAHNSKKFTDFLLQNDLLLKDIKNQTPQSYAQKLVQLLNAP